MNRRLAEGVTQTRLLPTFGVSSGLSAEHCQPQKKKTAEGPKGSGVQGVWLGFKCVGFKCLGVQEGGREGLDETVVGCDLLKNTLQIWHPTDSFPQSLFLPTAPLPEIGRILVNRLVCPRSSHNWDSRRPRQGFRGLQDTCPLCSRLWFCLMHPATVCNRSWTQL